MLATEGPAPQLQGTRNTTQVPTRENFSNMKDKFMNKISKLPSE